MQPDKLMKAKVSIILNQYTAFFASLMMKRPFIADSTIPTACTNGKVIRYNPEYIESLSQDEVVGLICHELLHITLLHHTRRAGRDLYKWNKAADFAINPILLNAGLRLPKGALNDKQYHDMSAENIYKMMAGDDKNDEQDGDKPDDSQPDNKSGKGGKPDANGKPDTNGKPDPNGIGGVEDVPATSEAELTQAEAETKQEIAAAMQIAKQQGNMPASLKRLIDEAVKPVVDWHEVLCRFISVVAKNDYSFTRPNTRYMSTGFMLPSLYNQEVGNIVLVVDTSGSINKKLLNIFAGEMQEVCELINSPITVLYVDTEVQGEPVVIEPNDDFKLEPQGGGGTDFKPAFKWLEENDIVPAALVYFTDMECSSFPSEPDFPVLWARYGTDKRVPPFGESIHVDK